MKKKISLIIGMLVLSVGLLSGCIESITESRRAQTDEHDTDYRSIYGTVVFVRYNPDIDVYSNVEGLCHSISIRLILVPSGDKEDLSLCVESESKAIEVVEILENCDNATIHYRHVESYSYKWSFSYYNDYLISVEGGQG